LALQQDQDQKIHHEGTKITKKSEYLHFVGAGLPHAKAFGHGIGRIEF
jgi:hypothetical protein